MLPECLHAALHESYKSFVEPILDLDKTRLVKHTRFFVEMSFILTTENHSPVSLPEKQEQKVHGT